MSDALLIKRRILRVAQIDLGRQMNVLQMVLQRVGAVDGQIVDLAKLQGRDQ